MNLTPERVWQKGLKQLNLDGLQRQRLYEPIIHELFRLIGLSKGDDKSKKTYDWRYCPHRSHGCCARSGGHLAV